MSLIPVDDAHALCPCCHKYYDHATGQRVKELEHVTVVSVDEKRFCLNCSTEWMTWPERKEA